jgi:hypothetical protein
VAQVFPKSANTLARLIIVGGFITVNVLGLVLYFLYTSPIVNGMNIAKAQPIPFSHQRHIAGNGLDCRYCHTSVENSNFAGVPPTETCMTCHSQILSDAPMLQPVHQSWKSGESLEWTRIYDVPDFVYFDHSIHIAKGVGCTTCHGEIDQMRITSKAKTLYMAWCLECHKAPEKFLRPLDKVFDVNWEAPATQIEDGLKMVEERNINVSQLTDCSICHR